jgi:hypothetical protein
MVARDEASAVRSVFSARGPSFYVTENANRPATKREPGRGADAKRPALNAADGRLFARPAEQEHFPDPTKPF